MLYDDILKVRLGNMQKKKKQAIPHASSSMFSVEPEVNS